MIIQSQKADARTILLKQLSSFYPLDERDVADIDSSIERAFERCDFSFSHVRNKYYQDGFDSLHSCQYTAFLYYLSNQLFEDKCASRAADKVYGLSCIVSSADLFYQIGLPDVMFFDHPRGTVMGRGSYSRYLQFGQGCTVGHNKGVYPRLGESVFLLFNSSVIGNCTIGDNVIIAANTFVKDTDIPSGSVVFGGPKDLVVKEGMYDYVRDYAEKLFIYD